MKEKKPLTLKKKIIRSSIVITVLIAVLVLTYYILVWTGAWESINSVDKIRELILSAGFWGRLAFVLLQFLQVTFLPIPSTISTLAGVLIYGPFQTALLSLAGILLGSVLAFALGRTFGRKLVVFMVGEETCEKWTKFLTNAKYSFFIMMVLPVFPDDVLCLVAGLTNMSWTFFVITNLISRPIGIFLTCYIGSGEIIPYHGWGLAVWAVIIVIVAVLLYLSFKFRPQIEKFLQEKFKTKKEKAKDKVEKDGKIDNEKNDIVSLEKNSLDKESQTKTEKEKIKRNKKEKIVEAMEASKEQINDKKPQKSRKKVKKEETISSE